MSASSGSLFFEPWIGPDYQRMREQGNRHVLQSDGWAHPYQILGESHYGRAEDYKPDLTRCIVERCGFRSDQGPCSAFFAKVLQLFVGDHLTDAGKSATRQEHWRKLAFSNYIQELLPEPGAAPSADQWKRAREAFPAHLAATTPQVLVVLGERLWENLPREFGFPVGKLLSMDQQLEVNDAWAYVYEHGGRKYLTLAICVTHPSAGDGAFKSETDAKRVLTTALFYSNIAVSDEFSSCRAVRLN